MAACVTIVAQCQAIASGFFLCWLEGRWDGGSSAVSCSQTPPLQQVQPVRNGRTKPARQHVQPANEAAGTEGILPAASGDWPLIGVKNRFYAPMPFSLCHSPILRSPASTTTTPTTTARRPRAARRDEQTLSPPAISELSQVLSHEANGVAKTASDCSMDPFSSVGSWIGIVNDGSGPSRIMDGATLTGRIRTAKVLGDIDLD